MDEMLSIIQALAGGVLCAVIGLLIVLAAYDDERRD